MSIFQDRADAINQKLAEEKQQQKIKMLQEIEDLKQEFKSALNDDEFFAALQVKPSVNWFRPELEISVFPNVFVSQSEGNWLIKLPYHDKCYSSKNRTDASRFLVETLLKVAGYIN